MTHFTKLLGVKRSVSEETRIQLSKIVLEEGPKNNLDNSRSLLKEDNIWCSFFDDSMKTNNKIIIKS